MLIRMKYLKRKKSGIYEFRRRVPNELVELLGKREFKTSLNTRSEAEALRKLKPLVEQSEMDIQRAKQRLARGESATLTFYQAQILSDQWLVKMRDHLDSNGTREAFMVWLVKIDGKIETLQGLDILMPDAVTDHAARRLDPYIDDVLENENLSYSKDSPSYNELRVAFNQAALQLSRYCHNRIHRLDASISAPLADKPSLRMASQTRLSAVAEDYLREREVMKDLSENTINEFKSCLHDFIGHFGDVDIKHIGRNEVREYRLLLLQQPASKKKSIRSMSLVDRITFAQQEGLEPVSKATVRRKLRLLSPLFTYAVEASYIEQNPFSQQTSKLRSEGRPDAKKTFIESDLAKMFAQPLFTTGTPEAINKRFGGAAYWVPLLLYYTGARREEICQLYGSDVLQSDGVWCLNITDAMPDQKLKNAGSRRVVPLHPDLIELGFLEYSAQTSGLLFPSLKSKSGDYGNNIGKWFGTYIRDLGIEIKQPVHGFRHTFKTLCRSVGISDGVQDWLTGHAPSNVGGAYGEYRIELLQESIAKLPSVPGFENLRTRKKQFPTGVAV